MQTTKSLVIVGLTTGQHPACKMFCSNKVYFSGTDTQSNQSIIQNVDLYNVP